MKSQDIMKKGKVQLPLPGFQTDVPWAREGWKTTLQVPLKGTIKIIAAKVPSRKK